MGIVSLKLYWSLFEAEFEVVEVGLGGLFWLGGVDWNGVIVG